MNWPPDDTGYGFDNIGDVLTISPMLLEKYMQAAETIVAAAVPRVGRVVAEIDDCRKTAWAIRATNRKRPLQFLRRSQAGPKFQAEHAGSSSWYWSRVLGQFDSIQAVAGWCSRWMTVKPGRQEFGWQAGKSFVTNRTEVGIRRASAGHERSSR